MSYHFILLTALACNGSREVEWGLWTKITSAAISHRPTIHHQKPIPVRPRLHVLFSRARAEVHAPEISNREISAPGSIR